MGYRRQRFIFQIFWKIKKKKTEVALSLILRFNLRLGGYSIWSATTSRTISEKRDSGLEHLIASMQPEKYSKNHSRRPRDSKPEQRIPEALESTRRHLQKYSTPAGLDYEELGGLSYLGQQDCSWV